MSNKIEKYSSLYALTYKHTGIPMKLVIPFMSYIEKSANKYLENRKEYFLNNNYFSNRDREKCDDVIVSLTSFPPRITTIWKTILSLKNQTYLPHKIILWLSMDDFPDKLLPESLKKMQDSLFEIRWVTENILAHKKYYYAFKEFEDYNIITVDDDVYYHRDSLKYLKNTSFLYPEDIIANRVREITYDNKVIKPYNEWKTRNFNKTGYKFFSIGIDGVWYPKGNYRKDLLKKEVFMELTPFADDVWLNAFVFKNGMNVRHTGFKFRNLPIAAESPSLESKNCDKGFNDLQIKKVGEYLLGKTGKDVFAPKFSL